MAEAKGKADILRKLSLRCQKVVKAKLSAATVGESYKEALCSVFNPNVRGPHSKENLVCHEPGGPSRSPMNHTLRKLRPTIRDYMLKPGQPNSGRLKGRKIVSKS